jgi:hypothetical protein
LFYLGGDESLFFLVERRRSVGTLSAGRGVWLLVPLTTVPVRLSVRRAPATFFRLLLGACAGWGPARRMGGRLRSRYGRPSPSAGLPSVAQHGNGTERLPPSCDGTVLPLAVGSNKRKREKRDHITTKE